MDRTEWQSDTGITYCPQKIVTLSYNPQNSEIQSQHNLMSKLKRQPVTKKWKVPEKWILTSKHYLDLRA